MLFLFLSIIYNLIMFLFVLFCLAFGLTWMLNPTASPKEIFKHWNKTFKKEN